MKISKSSLIEDSKIEHYLLKYKPRNDKSLWLASAGYTRENWRKLKQDIRSQLLPADANLVEITEYGELFELRGVLTGPNGKSLAVKTIWMKDYKFENYRFITMYPVKS